MALAYKAIINVFPYSDFETLSNKYGFQLWDSNSVIKNQMLQRFSKYCNLLDLVDFLWYFYFFVFPTLFLVLFLDLSC